MTASAPTPRFRLGDAAGAFAGALGVFVALGLLKFGNPVVLDHKLAPPGNLSEALVWSWPVDWAYPLLVLLAGWGVALRLRLGAVAAPPARPVIRWLAWLPLAWLFWQAASSIWTVHWGLTLPTLKHFAALTACFYLGFFVVSRLDNMRPFWLGVLGGFLGVIAVGLDQHFGGLEATRRFIYSQPDWQNQSAALLQKVSSNRIYGTLFYPNTLAGVILLLLPPIVAAALAGCFGRGSLVLGGMAALGGLACLYWSGSKAGWLIALALLTLASLRLPWARKVKWGLALALLLAGGTVFLIRYQGYFAQGASSMGARMDYWTAAAQIAAKRPLFGSGPGTFSVLYRNLRSPGAEMARLAHNDYLEQASDSGLLGALVYLSLWGGGLWLCCPLRAPPRAAFPSCPATREPVGGSAVTPAGRSAARPLVGWREFPPPDQDWLDVGLWLGLLGLALQSLVEFGLYVPAVAWPAFLLLGSLLGRRKAPKGQFLV
jgi:O-antigen ligase